MSDRPSPAIVAYDGPNPDGTRKNCINCYKWVKSTNQCIEFAKDQVVVADAICSNYVYGKPYKEWPSRIDRIDRKPLDPKISGLVVVSGGTSCDRCKAYVGDDNRGKCSYVAINDKDAPVDALGCCNAWTPKPDVLVKQLTAKANKIAKQLIKVANTLIGNK